MLSGNPVDSKWNEIKRVASDEPMTRLVSERSVLGVVS